MKNYVNDKMKRLGAHRSVIRELFEYANKRRAEIGDENVFDFSIGNPSAPTPAAITDEMLTLLKNTPPERLHAYTSAQGAQLVREKIARFQRFDLRYLRRFGRACRISFRSAQRRRRGNRFRAVFSRIQSIYRRRGRKNGKREMQSDGFFD